MSRGGILRLIHAPAVAVFPAGARLPERVLGDCELVWMLEGTARLVAEPVVVLRPGDLVLLPQGHRHSIEWDPARQTRHGYVHFDAADVGWTPAPGAVVVSATDEDPLTGLQRYLVWLGNGGELDQAAASTTLRYLLDVLFTMPMPTESAPRWSGTLRACLAHLRHRWEEPPLSPVSVAELAEVAAVSRAQVYRVFTDELALGPAAVVERLRCSRAETLLVRTDLTLASIARECGFADAAHLAHRFRALHGVPPGRYRAAVLPTSVLDHPGLRAAAATVWP
jgi:AraC-like DNA-binding protein